MKPERPFRLGRVRKASMAGAVHVADGSLWPAPTVWIDVEK